MRPIYLATTGDLDISGTRRVTAEFFSEQNGFSDDDRRQIATLEVDKLLMITSRGNNAHSIRRVE